MPSIDKSILSDCAFSKASSSRATSDSVCVAINVILSRDVPSGTVGGRMAVHKQPEDSSDALMASATSGDPTTTG